VTTLPHVPNLMRPVRCSMSSCGYGRVCASGLYTNVSRYLYMTMPYITNLPKQSHLADGQYMSYFYLPRCEIISRDKGCGLNCFLIRDSHSLPQPMLESWSPPEAFFESWPASITPRSVGRVRVQSGRPFQFRAIGPKAHAKNARDSEMQ
jgi:hypothetical protein